jgi:hypothetical protein
MYFTLLKLTTLSHNGISQSKSSGLNLTTCGFCNALQILDGDTTSAEDVSVREVLSGKIADRQLRKYNLRARVDNNVELVVDDLPLGIDNFLEVVGVLKTDLSGVLLCLQFKLQIQNQDLRVLERFRLLLKTCI